MKAKEREVKRTLTAVELQAELRGTREKLFNMTFKHRVSPAANPLELRGLRRHVARLETWIGERRRIAASEDR